jgi:hypothetical protein
LAKKWHIWFFERWLGLCVGQNQMCHFAGNYSFDILMALINKSPKTFLLKAIQQI